MRSVLGSTLLTILLAAATPVTHAQSMTPSDASEGGSLAIGASAMVVSGAALIAGSLVVVAVEAVGEATVVVLRGITSGTVTTVRLAGRLAGDIALVPGTVMVAVVRNTGVDLTVQGRVAAYVPSEAGAALVHSSRVSSYR